MMKPGGRFIFSLVAVFHLSRGTEVTGKCVRKKNIAYQGDVVGSERAYNVRGCKDKCSNKEECMYWTYWKMSMLCNLLSNMTSSQNWNGAISGNKACGGKCVRKKNIAYQGDVLGSERAYNVKGCKDKCSDKEECMYWTYWKMSMLCNLLSNMTGSQNWNGAISGDKACGEETDDVKNCKEETRMAYYGNNIENGFELKVKGKQSCIKKCIKRTGCHYWSYRTYDKKCWLKSSDGGRQSNGNYVSGKICGKADSPK